MARVEAIHGDSRIVLKTMPDATFHAVVSDPPYSLQTINKRFAKVGRNDKTWSKSGPHQRTARGFMNQKWDTGETAFDPDFWREVGRVMKPGGHLIAFGGTRTSHRMVCAIEDAGFEIRDQLMWIFGSGFPKSHDAMKAMDKHLGTPGRTVPEGAPVKRMIPGADQNKAGWKKDNGREYQPGSYMPGSDEAAEWEGWGTALKPAYEPIVLARWPMSGKTVAANLAEHRTGAINVDACRVDAPDGLTSGGNKRSSPLHMDRDAGINRIADRSDAHTLGRWPANCVHDGSEEVLAAFDDGRPHPSKSSPASERRNRQMGFGMTEGAGHGDTGSAARFFYSAKADAADRLQSRHPTVKPVDLMRWLVRLVTPKGGRVLDPFAGSGTTGMACMAEGFDCTLIEREAEYATDIRRRIAHVSGADTALFADHAVDTEARKPPLDTI